MREMIKILFKSLGYEIHRTSKFGMRIIHRRYGALFNNMDGQERQVAPTIQGIRKDHRARYKLACSYVQNEGKILDFACGIGYGSFILSKNSHAVEIDAVDKNIESIAYANKYYQCDKIKYIVENAHNFVPAINYYDLIVSFETIEHLEHIDEYLKRIAKSLKNTGIFICSTPNQSVSPFNPVTSKYHIRHYTPLEFDHLLKSNGFIVNEKKSQYSQLSSKIWNNWDGRYLIAICSKY